MALVHLFVGFNRHDELELIRRHFTLLGGLAVVIEPTARSSAALKGVAAVFSRTTFGAIVAAFLGRYRATIQPGAAIDCAFPAGGQGLEHACNHWVRRQRGGPAGLSARKCWLRAGRRGNDSPGVFQSSRFPSGLPLTPYRPEKTVT